MEYDKPTAKLIDFEKEFVLSFVDRSCDDDGADDSGNSSPPFSDLFLD